MDWIIKDFGELTPLELYEILSLRTEVFVVEQECAYQEVDGKDPVSYHLCAYDDGQLVAYTRLLPKGVSFVQASIGRVVIKASHRKRGLGQELIRRSLEFIRKKMGETRVQISAQAHLTDFYAAFGFVPVSEDYVEDGIPHQDMLLEMGE